MKKQFKLLAYILTYKNITHYEETNFLLLFACI